MTKSRMQNEPENFPRKERGKGQQKERRRKKVGKKKKSNGCTPSFYAVFFRDVERKRLSEERSALFWL